LFDTPFVVYLRHRRPKQVAVSGQAKKTVLVELPSVASVRRTYSIGFHDRDERRLAR
jgi:hypothetical protein